jgi:hypothetical protein
MAPKFTETPQFGSVLLGGLFAGSVAAALNGLYTVAFRVATGFDFLHPTYASIAISSIAPSVLAAAGYFALTRIDRLARRAGFVLAVITAAITLYSFEGVFRATLPDGSPKPSGFDALTLPMHVVVGFLAAFIIPRFVPTTERVRAWLAECPTRSGFQGS